MAYSGERRRAAQPSRGSRGGQPHGRDGGATATRRHEEAAHPRHPSTPRPVTSPIIRSGRERRLGGRGPPDDQVGDRVDALRAGRRAHGGRRSSAPANSSCILPRRGLYRRSRGRRAWRRDADTARARGAGSRSRAGPAGSRPRTSEGTTGPTIPSNTVPVVAGEASRAAAEASVTTSFCAVTRQPRRRSRRSAKKPKNASPTTSTLGGNEPPARTRPSTCPCPAAR